MLSIINLAAYRFIQLPDRILPKLKISLKTKANELGLKGTILLSVEGINLFISGKDDAICFFQNFLDTHSYFQNLQFNKSFSNFQPFKKMMVKIKKEIISFGVNNFNHEKYTAPYITPNTLTDWLKNKSELILIDTRNNFEFELGSFKNALNLNLKRFRDFPNAVKNLPEKLKKLPIVTFCTGGIRCEKAAVYLLAQGFQKVYQLEGGILNYFEKCGEKHFQGTCFVFDARERISPPSLIIS
jgi:UPF0176 protein